MDIERAIINKVAELIRVRPEQVNLQRNLSDYGLGSTCFARLRHWIGQEFGVELLVASIIGAENLEALVNEVKRKDSMEFVR